MDLPIYLAMTAGEFRQVDPLPEHPGWMSCHFSSASTGLSNLPERLPKGSLLILDDSVPMADHDADRIHQELEELLGKVSVDGLLLDLQRPPEEKTLRLVKALSSLPCPVAVTEDYAKTLSCAVFLAPCPAYMSLEEHLEKWKGREIWLEAALSSHTLTLTEAGCKIEDGCVSEAFPHWDEKLCCHYDMAVLADRAVFSLARTGEDLSSHIAAAGALGVKRVVGLYQELKCLL